MADAITKPSRADEVRQERRRKPGSVAMSGIKLGVDESKLDRETYEYRWVNDHGARMSRLHHEDWDVAPEQAAPVNDGEGSVNRKIAGTDEAGKPMSAILMRKRKDWYRGDQAEKMKPLEEMDQAIRRGANHQGDEPDLRSGVYTPNGQNVLERG